MSIATAPSHADRLTCPPPPAPRRTRASRWLLHRRGLREFLLIAVVYSMYDGSRYLVAGKQAAAFTHAIDVLHLETLLDVDWEHALNRIVSAHALLAVPADYIYATLHYIVTPVVLVWLWRSHRYAYNRARTTLMVATIIGLVGFSVIPVAPPRLLPGFVDTMAQYSGFGWWSTEGSAPRGVGGLTNQFAAMPSLHVGWAVWCGLQMVRYGAHRLTRVLGAAYPALITLVVIATGNHYLLDAVAGLAVVVLSAASVQAVARLLPPRVVSVVEPRAPLASERVARR